MPSPLETTMADMRRELDALLAPVMPRPLPPVADPIYQMWRKAFRAYVDRKTDLLDGLRAIGGHHAAA